MKSPFAIFRKHEKVMMVILVGLSMIGFVLLGAINSAAEKMPPVLVLLVAMAVFGMAAWIAGMPSGRSKEYGGWGLVLGAAVSFLIIHLGRPASAVHADFGNLSQEELRNLQARREMANKFVFEAIRETAQSNDPTTEQRLAVSQFRFGANAASPRDVVLGEILRREADRLGLVANNESVTQYIQKMTSKRMTAEQFNKILGHLHLSENQLYDILKEQIQAKTAAQLLYEPAFALPPEKYWQFYRQLYIKETADVTAVPVNDFVDESATPPPAELNQIFSEYRENYPNQTKEGRLEEGRPGLYQPRRAKLAFLEATYEDAESGIEPVTDQEIQAYYEENYKRPAEEAARRKAAADAKKSAAPANPGEGPGLPGPFLPETGTTPPDSTQPSSTSDDQPQSTPASPSESTESPEGAGSTPPTPEGSQPPPADCAQETDGETSKSPSPPSAESAPPEKAAPPAADSPGTPDSAPATTGSTSQPAAADAVESTNSTTAPAVVEPPLPQPTVPVLDDMLKETIRKILVDERVAEKLNRKLQTAADYVQDKIGRAFIFTDQNAKPMTTELASKNARDYAAEQHLDYAETPFLSTAELVEQSEEYPVGMARTTTPGREDFVARAIFATGERDLYRPIIAHNDTTRSWFACWKVAEEAAFAPENMNNEQVLEQVIDIWRQLKAREKAQSRAQELAQQVRDSGKSMNEVLGEQHITGSDSSLLLNVINTGEFHYQAFANQLDPNPLILQYLGQPQILSPTGVDKAGPGFMQTVFNELSPGDVGVAANVDHSTFYVVKVLTRSQSTPEEFDKFRQGFLQEPLFGYYYGGFRRSVYQNLAIGDLQQNLLDWQDRLLREHGVQLSSLEK